MVIGKYIVSTELHARDVNNHSINSTATTKKIQLFEIKNHPIEFEEKCKVIEFW